MATAHAQEGMVGWGTRTFDSRYNQEAFVEIAAGGFHTLARRSDGTVVSWGYGGQGQLLVPTLPPGVQFAQLAAGDTHSVGCCSDGSMRAWGDNSRGQCNVPSGSLPAVPAAR